MMRSNRAGGALLIALLGLLFVELIVAGTLAVGVGERLMSAARVRHLQTRLAAESGVRTTIATWTNQEFDTLPMGARVAGSSGLLPDSIRYSAEVERIGDAFFLVRGHGSLTARQGTANAAAVIAVIPRAELWREFAAAVTTVGDAVFPDSAVIDGMQATTQCPAVTSEMLSALGSAFVPAIRSASTQPFTPAAGLSLAGLPLTALDTTLRSPAARARIAGILLSDFDALADRIESGTVLPAPAVNAGVCDPTAAGNWGDPLNSGAPCANWFPLIYAPGNLDIAGGAGQGMLVVNGSVRFAPGAVFRGAVVAAGSIETAGARIEGALRSMDTTKIRLSGTVRYDACALSRLFHLSPGLRRPFRPAKRWWIPVF
jgi:hypothetical protein